MKKFAMCCWIHWLDTCQPFGGLHLFVILYLALPSCLSSRNFSFILCQEILGSTYEDSIPVIDLLRTQFGRTLDYKTLISNHFVPMFPVMSCTGELKLKLSHP